MLSPPVSSFCRSVSSFFMVLLAFSAALRVGIGATTRGGDFIAAVNTISAAGCCSSALLCCRQGSSTAYFFEFAGFVGVVHCVLAVLIQRVV